MKGKERRKTLIDERRREYNSSVAGRRKQLKRNEVERKEGEKEGREERRKVKQKYKGRKTKNKRQIKRTK